MATRPVTGLSLCSGGGGLELGLTIAIPDYECVCHVERESYAASVLVARMAEKAIHQAPIWDDITTFDGLPWRGLVDIISAGDPCQPWSHAGQRKGYDDERVVFDDVARIVSQVEPEFVFLENVAGAIDFRYDCKAVLEGMGYRVEAGLFSAAEVGAPHGRLRIFLLAHSESIRSRGRGDGDSGGGRCTPETARPDGELAHSESGCESSGAGTAGQQRCATPAESGTKLDDPQERSVWHDCEDIGQDSRDVNAPADASAQLQHAPHNPAIEGVSVADTGCGDGTQAESEQKQFWSSVSSESSLPLFPPRPNDLEAWREVIEETRENGPCVEPSVCRMADWTTYRVERLQALGNAVVPLTAALAFRTLWGRLSTIEREERENE